MSSVYFRIHMLNSKSWVIFVALSASSHDFQEHSACENSRFADSFFPVKTIIKIGEKCPTSLPC